jgi:hypothetical protein
MKKRNPKDEAFARWLFVAFIVGLTLGLFLCGVET